MNEYWNEKLKLLTPMFHNNEVNSGEDTESIILELQQIAKDQREACERETKLEVAKPGPCRDIPQRPWTNRRQYRGFHYIEAGCRNPIDHGCQRSFWEHGSNHGDCPEQTAGLLAAVG